MSNVLTKQEVEDFHRFGFHAPLRAMSEREAARLRHALESFERRYPDDVIKLDQKANMLCPWIDEMVRLPGLLRPVKDLLGPNLLCWGTSLRLKEAEPSRRVHARTSLSVQVVYQPQ